MGFLIIKNKSRIFFYLFFKHSRQFWRFPEFWEVPGPEIRILRKISSPEPAGNVISPQSRPKSGQITGHYPEVSWYFSGNFPNKSRKNPRNSQEISWSFPEIWRLKHPECFWKKSKHDPARILDDSQLLISDPPQIQETLNQEICVKFV